MATATSRFADNTISQPIDRTRVYGFGPGLRMTMNPRGSNIAGWRIPQGQLVLFKPRVDGYMKERMVSVTGKNGERLTSYDAKQEYSGQHFAEAVAAKFHGGKDDFGFRILECLTDLPYDKSTGWDEADDYFNALHPKITCEMGLEEDEPRGPAGDIINNGQPLPCPTCRIKWLENEGVKAVANTPLDPSRPESLRQVLLSSYKAGRTHAQVRFDKSKGEVEQGTGKKAYDDADYHFMKMLHKKPAHIEQAEIQTQAAKVQGEAISESIAKVLTAQTEAFRAREIEAENERLKKELEALKKAKK